MTQRLLFIGKEGDPYAERAQAFVRQHWQDAIIVTGRRGMPLPEAVRTWTGDILISYLSPWIIPASVLAQARLAALNFHPGPPEYPGIGCTNFALYDQAATFGVTCHHMAPQVDTGAVVAVSRFPILPADDVHSLTQRCYVHILALFTEIATALRLGRSLPSSDEHWTRRPYRRAELEDLCRLRLEMPADEMRRRIRATAYPGMPGAYLDLHGIRFLPGERPAIPGQESDHG